MRLRSILLIAAGAVIVLLAVAVVVVSRMDFGAYRQQILARAEAATGRKVTIEGELTLSLLPVPALKVKGVSLANAAWGSRPEMATIGELSARVQVVPLLFGGSIHIVQLVMKDADIWLETDRNGHGNWDFGQPQTPTQASLTQPPNAASASAFPVLAFDGASLQNITVTYSDGKTHTREAVTLSDLALSGSLGGPLRVKAAVGVAGAKVTLDGSIAAPLAGHGLNFELGVDGVVSDEIASLAGLAYHLAGTITGDVDKDITMTAFHGTAGATAFAGDGEIDMSGLRPRVTIGITSSYIDLTELPKAAAKPSSDGRLFSKAPLPLDGLDAIDANITLAVAALKTETAMLNTVSAHLTLDERVLKIAPIAFDLDGSHLVGTVDLSAARTPARLAVTLDGKAVNVGRILALASGVDLLDAKGDLSVAVHGTGISVRAVMASLDGTANMVVKGGIIKNRYADLVGADVFREAFSWSQGKKDTKLNCLVARFTVVNGVATSRGMLMDTADMSMLGVGTINLATESLFLEFTPRPKEASLLNLATPVDVGGTFANPSFQPNKLAVAKRVAGGVVTTINPLFAIGELVYDASDDSDKNPCVAALEGKDAQAKKEEGGVSGAVHGLESKFNDIFK